MTGRLQDRAALVTGAGSGIGEAIARRLASEGARVAVTDYQADAASQTAARITEAGGRALALALDVARPDDIDAAFAHVGQHYGPLDILVNNAGVFDGMTPLEELTDQLWDRVLAINLGGAMRMTRRALADMLPRESGAIVNTASIAGLAAMGGGAAYTASKFALIGLTRQVACEVADRGIRVNAVAPGLITTNLFASTDAVLGPAAGHGPRAQAAAGKLAATALDLIPQRRPGTPDQVAAAVAFLASDDAAYTTGHVLLVEGGYCA